jgi:GTPase Era involved in 16S rRNA processing
MLNSVRDVDDKVLALLSDCASYAKEHDMKTEAGVLENYALKNEELLYQIAIVGFMKRGKSTLLNALLSRGDSTLAPTSALVCTAAIVKYLDVSLHEKNQESAVVHLLNGEEVEIPHAELESYINNRYNRENRKSVRFVRVYGEFPLISSSAAIVDTPGKGTIFKEHDILADEFIPVADAIVLVLTADLPVEADERIFLSRLTDEEKKRVLVVLTKKDTLESETDRAESEEFVRSQLREIGIPCKRIYFVSAQKVIDARKAGDEAVERAAKEWGISNLERAIEDLILKNSDKSVLRQKHLGDIESALRGFISLQIERLEDHIESAKGSVEELEQKRKALSEATDRLQKEFSEKSKAFQRNWEEGVSRFMDRLRDSSGSIADELSRDFESGGLLKLWDNEKRLQKRIGEVIDRECRKHFEPLQDKLDKELASFTQETGESVQLPAGGKLSGRDLVVSSLTKVASTAGTVASGTVVVQAGSSVASAWGTFLTAQVASTTAAAAAKNAGLIAQIGAFLWGAGSGTAGNAVVAAATATGTAQGALITAIGSSVAGVGAMSGTYLAYRVLCGMLTQVQRSKSLAALPELVDKALSEVAEPIATRLNDLCHKKIRDMRTSLEEDIENNEAEKAKILEALKNNDPSVRKGMEKDLETMYSWKLRLTELQNAIDMEKHRIEVN